MAIAVDGAASILATPARRIFRSRRAPSTVIQPPLDVFVTKLDATGALVYSTFLGGGMSDNALAIAVDGAGNAFVFGWTP
jgi:hypothetical protein